MSSGVTLATPSVVVYTVFIGDSTPSRSAISVVAACPISSERRKYPVFAETAVALWMVRTP